MEYCSQVNSSLLHVFFSLLSSHSSDSPFALMFTWQVCSKNRVCTFYLQAEVVYFDLLGILANIRGLQFFGSWKMKWTLLYEGFSRIVEMINALDCS